MQTADPLRVTVQLTFGEILGFCYVILARSKSASGWTIAAIKNALFVSALFFVMCAAICRISETYAELALRALVWGSLFIVFFFPIFMIVFPPLLMAIMRVRGMLPRTAIVYSFFGDRIEIGTETSNRTLAWTGFRMIRETNGQFLLYYQKYQALVFPKRCFAAQEEIVSMRKLIRENFQGKITLRSG